MRLIRIDICPFCTAKAVVQIFFHSLGGVGYAPRSPSGYAYVPQWLVGRRRRKFKFRMAQHFIKQP